MCKRVGRAHAQIGRINQSVDNEFPKLFLKRPQSTGNMKHIHPWN